jgi:hypothetical protein
MLLLGSVSLGACAALETLAALQEVRFRIDGVSDGRLAGVPLEGVRRLDDLAPRDLARIAGAYYRDSVPLRFTLHVGATNPGTNDVDARLERLDWTLLLDGRETVSGVYDRNLLLPAGRTVDLPLGIDLDLLRFFRESQDGLARLALDVAGGQGTGDRLELRARPTISTPLGPIRYPGEIVIRP